MTARSHSKFQLKAVRPTRVAEQIFDELARLIMAGDLGPGETMPSERTLAEQFGVSRLLVRQAIHRLGDLGLLTVRQGGATVVTDPAHCDHPEVGVLALRFSPDTDRQVRALRERQIAGGLSMLLLAARHFQPTDADALYEIVDAYAADPEADHDEAFWTYLAQLTANSFFQRETRYWFRVVREHEPLRARSHLPHDLRVAGYRSLVDRLKVGTGVLEAYAAMATMLLDGLNP